MNTLTIAILVVCATAAYATALPGQPAEEAKPAAVAPAEELLQGEESRHGGGGYYKGGGYNHGSGGYHHGGGGYHHGGGGYHHGGGGYHRGHHGK